MIILNISLFQSSKSYELSLLIELISELRPSERRDARYWLATPLHNKQQELILLFDYLEEWIHQLKLNIDEKAAFQHARPQQKFTPDRWAKLTHKLLACLEQFLSYRRFSQNEFAQRNELLAFYRERGLYSHLQTRVRRYDNRYPTGAATAAADRFFHDHQLKKEVYFLNAVTKRTAKHNLLDQENSLLLAIMSTKFRQACATLAHLRLFPQRDYQIPLLEELLQLYAAAPRPDLPGIHIYYLATLLYRARGKNSDELFQELKQELEQHIDAFPHHGRRDLLILAVNHCVRQANAGRVSYLRQSLDLYQLGLQRKGFYEGGQISIYTFNNILGVALRLGEVDWAASFLESNVRRLPPEKKGEVESLSRARLSFQRGDFDQTLQFLRTADYQDVIHHLTARVMQMKIYYQRDDYNLFTSHVRATKAWLRRKKKLGYHQKNYLNIFTLAEKIQRLPPGDRSARIALSKKIEETEPCTEKPWLLRAVAGNF
ncbi:hypothetical protein CEQ90_03930 [Lewinellaceae bacterium SD302]|nr:hypothetical protein CEQ90_03930 [Lewinellaceae bacterium SD302]